MANVRVYDEYGFEIVATAKGPTTSQYELYTVVDYLQKAPRFLDIRNADDVLLTVQPDAHSSLPIVWLIRRDAYDVWVKGEVLFIESETNPGYDLFYSVEVSGSYKNLVSTSHREKYAEKGTRRDDAHYDVEISVAGYGQKSLDWFAKLSEALQLAQFAGRVLESYYNDDLVIIDRIAELDEFEANDN